MKRHIRSQMAALSLVAALAAVNAQATVIYKVTFNNDGAVGGPANSTYTLAPGDVIPAGVTLTRRDGGSGGDGGTSIPQITTSTYLYGGNALALSPHSGDYAVGYYGSAGSANVIVPNGGGATFEAVVKMNSYNGVYAGSISAAQGVAPNFRFEVGTVTVPQLDFQLGGISGAQIDYASAVFLDGQYHHVAGVWSRDSAGTSATMQLYVDGLLVQTLPGVSTTAGNEVFPTQNIEIGSNAIYYNVQNRNLDGALDAVAFSTDALAPGSFILEAVPEPSSIMLLGCGAAVFWLRRRRQTARL